MYEYICVTHAVFLPALWMCVYSWAIQERSSNSSKRPSIRPNVQTLFILKNKNILKYKYSEIQIFWNIIILCLQWALSRPRSCTTQQSQKKNRSLLRTKTQWSDRRLACRTRRTIRCIVQQTSWLVDPSRSRRDESGGALWRRKICAILQTSQLAYSRHFQGKETEHSPLLSHASCRNVLANVPKRTGKRVETYWQTCSNMPMRRAS